MRSPSRMLKHFGTALALLNLGMASGLAVAGDNTWTNSSTDFTWNTSSLNWSGAGNVWNNAAGDGAIFGVTGIGTIDVPGAINVNSVNFQQNGYTINGAGSLNFVNGTSTQTTGVINVASGTTQINVPLTSAQTAIQKIGAGTLELSAPMNVTASFGLNSLYSANLIIGPAPSGISPVGGTVRVLNSSVLPSSTNVLIGSNGLLDIGANNVTINNLLYTNNNASVAFDTINNRGSNGPMGAGNLKVNGDIVVFGVTGNNFGNFINTPLDLGGKEQVVRINSNGSSALNGALMFVAPISNGSFTKTIGFTLGSNSYGATDGLSLYANNTYTGATRLNAGTNVATGTNASTSLTMYGTGGLAGSSISLQGANGSFLSATTLNALSGGTLVLNNNAAITLTSQPNIPAAQNNNRIRDDAAIELRDGGFTYQNLLNTAGSETFGSMLASGGHNVVTMTVNGASLGGAITLTNAGNLTLNPRTSMQVNATGTGAILGTNAKYLVSGTVPAAVGGIIPRMIGPSDFVFYDPTNGFTPLSSYSSTLSAGANVSYATAQSTAGSVTINALKTTTTLTTTINSGDTLGVTTGMIFSTSGTHTISGAGTLALGNNPGAFYGTITLNSPVTGTQGLIQPTGTLTLAGDLSGLSGTISNIGTGTMVVSTNTFTGPIEVRRGTLNIGASLLSAPSSITLGVPANATDLLPANPTMSLSAAGAGAVISTPIIVDNGATNAKGLTLDRFSFLPLLQPLSNTTGSQTVNSNITLNTSLNFQGGGAGGSGSTTFGGNITGNGTFVFANGRASFTGSYTNAGGFYINSGGFTSIVTLAGTGGSGPIFLNAGSTSTSGISYSSQTNLGTSVITVQNSSGANAPTLTASANSSINNTINLNGDVFASVPSGVTAVWGGVLAGDRTLTKNNTGTLVVAGNANTHTGPVTVSAGTLAVNGNIAASANAVTVNANGTLGGSGTISRTVTVNANGKLAPGNSPGQLTIDGNLTLAGGSTFQVELNGTTLGTGYDNVTVAGLARTVTISNAGLSPTTTSPLFASTDKMFIMVLNDSASTLGTTFAYIPQDGPVFIPGVSGGESQWAQVSYTGDFGSGNLTGGNDVVLYNFSAVPEPTTIALLGLLGAGGVGGWYYRRRRLAKQMEAKL